jgi:phosphate transport system substrate-binding protein
MDLRAVAMSLRALLLTVPVTLAVACAHAQDLDSLAAYQARQEVAGTIRTWGHVFVRDAMKRWEEGFRKYHPDIKFEDNLVSSAAAIGALYAGAADIGFIGREIRPLEVAGYSRVMNQKPFAFRVMTGSYTNADKLVALGIFVHKDNPLTRLTYSQLDAIFGSENLRAGKRIRTWDQIGLRGPWAKRRIQVYTGVLDAAPAFYFSQEVMKGSLLWNGDLRYFDDLAVPGGKDIEAGQRIVDALASDRYGIAVSGAGYRNPNVKLVAIAAADDGPFIEATPTTVANRTYPFTRSVWLYINHASGQTIDPKVAEFLRYILSREGQATVKLEGDYFPLTPEVAREELGKLDGRKP